MKTLFVAFILSIVVSSFSTVSNTLQEASDTVIVGSGDFDVFEYQEYVTISLDASSASVITVGYGENMCYGLTSGVTYPCGFNSQTSCDLNVTLTEAGCIGFYNLGGSSVSIDYTLDVVTDYLQYGGALTTGSGTVTLDPQKYYTVEVSAYTEYNFSFSINEDDECVSDYFSTTTSCYSGLWDGVAATVGITNSGCDAEGCWYNTCSFSETTPMECYYMINTDHSIYTEASYSIQLGTDSTYVGTLTTGSGVFTLGPYEYITIDTYGLSGYSFTVTEGVTNVYQAFSSSSPCLTSVWDNNFLTDADINLSCGSSVCSYTQLIPMGCYYIQNYDGTDNADITYEVILGATPSPTPNPTLNPTSNPTLLPTPLPTPQPTPQPTFSDDSTDDNTAAVVGGTVGAIVGIAGIGGLLFYFNKKQGGGDGTKNQVEIV